MDIRCRKTTCKFNNNHTCMAKEITISSKMECGSYQIEEILKTQKDKQSCCIENKNSKNANKTETAEAKNSKTDDYSKHMFKTPPKNAPFRNRKKININCEANCLFNVDKVCWANGITINDSNKELPVCMSFLEK